MIYLIEPNLVLNKCPGKNTCTDKCAPNNIQPMYGIIVYPNM